MKSQSQTHPHSFPAPMSLIDNRCFPSNLTRYGCGSNVPKYGLGESYVLLYEPVAAVCGFLFFVYLRCFGFRVED
jgi:hypothetical protein